MAIVTRIHSSSSYLHNIHTKEKGGKDMNGGGDLVVKNEIIKSRKGIR